VGPEHGDSGPRSAGTLLAHNESDVIEAVRDAGNRRAPLRIAGRGTWPLGGYPVAAGSTLDVSRLTGITEYVPGDLTLTARAGTTLAEITEATRTHGQWLPLDPPGAPEGTIGATLATASAGPLAASIALPRDVTVGLSFIAGDGRLVHGGGRVVKNVAGFDLVRLTIGAWGTLGVIVSATVRLRARPEVDETVALPVPEDAERLGALLVAFRDAPVEPLAAELLSPSLAGRLGLDGEPTLLVRVAGNAIAVSHQRGRLERLAPAIVVPGETWSRLRASDPPAGCIVRLSRRPTELARLWSVASAVPGAELQATVARGIVRIRWSGTAPADALSAFDARDVRVLEQHAVEGAIPLAAPPDDALARRVRLAFDPHGILNPGVLGEATP
jgi:glycolate oxidase FAD binding subunit